MLDCNLLCILNRENISIKNNSITDENKSKVISILADIRFV